MTALNKWECTFESTRYHFSKPCGRFWDQMFDENARLRFDARRGLFLFKIDSLTHGVAFRDLIAQTPKKSRGTAAILKIRRHKIKRATKCSNIALNSSKLYKKLACRFDAKTTIDHFLTSIYTEVGEINSVQLPIVKSKGHAPIYNSAV